MTDTQAALPLLLADTPAKAEEDLLGFQPHADRLAAMLLKQQFPEASFVVGIEGEWGEGKSSFINCLKQRFAAPKQDQGEILPDVVEFNPWWFENPEKTASNLLETIINGRDQNDKEAIKALEALSAALNHITPWLEKLASSPLVLTALFGVNTLFTTKNAPWLGALIAAGLSLALYIAKQYLSRHRVWSESLAGLKQKAAVELRSEKRKGQKQIVIIDDLDRLSHQEIREVFRAVKGVLDLPNIVYVIAYDRAIVASALDEVHKGRGEAYLEKIVQLPYRLPKPTFEQWHGFTIEGLLHIDCVRRVEQEGSEDVRRGLLSIAAGFLSTPRDVKRLQSALILTGHVPGDIGLNPLDFVLLEAMRLKNRALWQAVIDAWQNVAYYNLEYGRQHNDATMGGKNTEAKTKLWLGVYFPAGKYRTEELVALQYFTNWPLIEPQLIGREVRQRDDYCLLHVGCVWPEFSLTASGFTIRQLGDNYLQHASAQEA